MRRCGVLRNHHELSDRFFSERVESVAELPQKYQRTYQDEDTQNVPPPERSSAETIGRTESTNSATHLVPPNKWKDTQGEGS